MRPVRTQQQRLTEPSAVRVAARAPSWIVPSVKVALVLTDAVIAALAFMAAFYIREGTSLFATSSSGSVVWSPRFAPYGALLLVVVCIRVLSLKYCDLYRLRGEFSPVDPGEHRHHQNSDARSTDICAAPPDQSYSDSCRRAWPRSGVVH